MTEIKSKDVPEKYQQLVAAIGFENFLQLSCSFGGTEVYIPKSDMLVKAIRNDRIKQEFNGGNYKELALKYNLSESQIRNIINYCNGIEGQLSLLGEAL